MKIYHVINFKYFGFYQKNYIYLWCNVIYAINRSQILRYYSLLWMTGNLTFAEGNTLTLDQRDIRSKSDVQIQWDVKIFKRDKHPSLSELTPMIFYTELTYLGSEASTFLLVVRRILYQKWFIFFGNYGQMEICSAKWYAEIQFNLICGYATLSWWPPNIKIIHLLIWNIIKNISNFR